MDPRTLTIQVDLQIDGDSFRGFVTDESGARHELRGWLGLIGALDDLIAAGRPGEPVPPEPHRRLQ
jgi:hypothetical protein